MPLAFLKCSVVASLRHGDDVWLHHSKMAACFVGD